MLNTKFKNYTIYYNFLNALAKELTRFYYKKLDKPFKVINKAKRKGYDPVTPADRAFEKCNWYRAGSNSGTRSRAV